MTLERASIVALMVVLVSSNSLRGEQTLDSRNTEREANDDGHLCCQLHLQAPYQIYWENEKGDLKHWRSTSLLAAISFTKRRAHLKKYAVGSDSDPATLS